MASLLRYLFHNISSVNDDTQPDRPLFGEEDIKILQEQFPPSRVCTISQRSPLLPLQTGIGLRKTHEVEELLKEIIDTELRSLAVSKIALALDLAEQQIRSCLPAEDDQSDWTIDHGSTIITRAAYRDITQRLLRASRNAPVQVFRFADENELSVDCFRTLVRRLNARFAKEEATFLKNSCTLVFTGSSEEWLYSVSYRDIIRNELARLLESVTLPYSLKSSDFTGAPPQRFISCFVNFLQQRPNSVLNGSFQMEADKILFVPSSYLHKLRESLVQNLEAGTIKSVSLDDIIGLFPSRESAEDYLTTGADGRLIFLSQRVISNLEYEDCVRSVINGVSKNGFATLNATNLELSHGDTQVLAKKIWWYLKSLSIQDKRIANTNFIDGVFIGDWFVETLREDARAQAESQAKICYKNGSDDKVSFRAIQQDQHHRFPSLGIQLLADVYDSETRARLESTFNVQKDKLQQEAADRFANLWREKVMGRFQLHDTGIEELEDVKLVAELQAALYDYMTTSIMNNTIQRAKSESLLRGKSLTRNVEDLERSVSSNDLEEDPQRKLNGLRQILHTFASKQKINWCDEALLRARKLSILQDMVRTLNGPIDDARLFLTLVVVLLASKNHGIVYASGRFAPRLLKQLRTGIEPNRFDWLLRLKEAAKKSSITRDDRNVALSVAEQAVLE